MKIVQDLFFLVRAGDRSVTHVARTLALSIKNSCSSEMYGSVIAVYNVYKLVCSHIVCGN
jgi:hypothetical protein